MGAKDRGLAEIAGCQHGIVSRSQVEATGLSADAIDRWVRNGRLHRMHPGVYAVGHGAITVPGRWMAAVLASGPGAVLSHRSATALWGIWGSGAGETHVTVPRKSRSHRSIRRHFGALPFDEVTNRDGIPVTSAARAVLDLAADKGEAAAESALRELEYLGIYGPLSIPALLDRHSHHRGATVLHRCLERLEDDPGGRVRSPLEELFLPFLDAHHLPRPRLNVWLSFGDDRFQVDCYWPAAHLVGELDGFQAHSTKRVFHADRKRDRQLVAASYRVIRITADQLRSEPTAVAADLSVSLDPPERSLPRSRT